MKKTLWYITIIPLTIFMLIWAMVMWIPVAWLVLHDVVDHLIRRYEMWCFNVKPSQLSNEPTLKQVISMAFQKVNA